MTAALALNIQSQTDLRQQVDDGDLHACHAKNTRQSYLGLAIHLQIPYQDNGQETQGEITNCCRDTVKVCDVDEDVCFQTTSIPRPFPEIFHRHALQGQHEPKHQPHHNR